MKLTGKCKEDFDKWYVDNYCQDLKEYSYMLEFNIFNCMYDEMKYGVYVDFFDSVGIWLMDNMFSIENDIANEFICQVETFDLIWNTVKESRQESRIEAIKRANEIYNDNTRQT